MTNTTKTLPLDLKKIFDTYQDDNQKVWEYDRLESLGASSAFACIRRSFYAKTKAPVDEGYVQTWGAMARGNLIEDAYVVPAMYNFIDNHEPGFGLLGAGENQKTFVKGRTSSTSDGLLVDVPSNFLENYGIPDIKSESVVFEIKSIDPRVQLSEAKAIHQGQVQVQMGTIRDLTNYKPNYAIILYIDCSFFDNMKVFIHKFSPKEYKLAQKRADSIFVPGAVAKDFTPEGRLSGACDLCEYRDICAVEMKDSIPDGDDAGNALEPADEKVAGALINSERAADKQMKDATAAHKAAKAAVAEFLKDKGRKLVRSPDFSVTIAWRDGKKSLDKDALADDMTAKGMDIDDYYTTGRGYEVVTVRKR